MRTEGNADRVALAGNVPFVVGFDERRADLGRLEVSTNGKPVFVGLAPDAGESTDAWADFLTDPAGRGLACPLLVVSGGACGPIAVIEA